MTKTAKPYDMSKAKEKPSLRGLFSTMVIKPVKEAPEEMGSEEEYEEEGMEEEGADEEEMTESEHIGMAKEAASNVRSALESKDISSAMKALDSLESHLEQCAA